MLLELLELEPGLSVIAAACAADIDSNRLLAA